MNNETDQTTGRVQTVLGEISSSELGITLSHEHCLIDITCTFAEPRNVMERKLSNQPLSFENVGHVRYHPLENRDNLMMKDEELAISEFMHLKNAGGASVADVTNADLGRDPEALSRISKATGLNIIMGSGYYEESAQQAELMKNRSEEDIAKEIIADIRDGVNGTGIRAGLIGEIGCTWPLKPLERKVLRAAGIAQLETGAPLVVHPGRNENAPMELLKILDEVGTDMTHTVISHIDRTVFDPSNRYRLAEKGCFLAYDIWGTEGHYPSTLSITDVLNDTQRIAHIMDLISKGYGSQILISHDICWKCRYRAYGGHGYAHILNNVVPLMENRGTSRENIDALLIENPQRFFPFRASD